MKIPKEGYLLQDAQSRDFPGDPVAKKPPSNAGDMGSIPGLEGSHMQEDPTWGQNWYDFHRRIEGTGPSKEALLSVGLQATKICER